MQTRLILSAVQRVMQNMPLMFNNAYIKINAYREGEDSPPDSMSSTLLQPSVTLEVRGFSPVTLDSTLENYFDNEKSGGEEEAIITPIERKDGVVYVKFKNEQGKVESKVY